MEEKIIRIKPEGAREFYEVLKRTNADKPDAKDMKELRRWLKEHPELASAAFDFGQVVRAQILQECLNQKGTRLCLETDIEQKQKALGWGTCSMLEKLLIEDVLNSWLRLRWLEYRYQRVTSGAYYMPEAEHWEKRLSAAQRRYLRAVETLARVRKMNINLQVNIAAQGGQQVNLNN